MVQQCNRPPLRNELASTAPYPRSKSLEILGRRFAGPAISDQFERHLLAFLKALQTGAFDRAGVNKDVPRPVVRLDKSEALLAVEPLHGSPRHRTLSSGCACNQGGAEPQPMKSEIWEKFVGLTQSAQAKSFGRTRFALGSVFLAASQEGSTLTKHEVTRAGQPVFLYRPSSLAVGKTG
jgi:hypothetical protein